MDAPGFGVGRPSNEKGLFPESLEHQPQQCKGKSGIYTATSVSPPPEAATGTGLHKRKSQKPFCSEIKIAPKCGYQLLLTLPQV